MIPAYGDLVWCATMPRECPPGIGWAVRVATGSVIAALAVLAGVLVGALAHRVGRWRSGS